MTKSNNAKPDNKPPPSVPKPSEPTQVRPQNIITEGQKPTASRTVFFTDSVSRTTPTSD